VQVGKGLLVSLLLAAIASCSGPPPWRGQLEGIGVRFISARELKAMLDRREDFVLIDARDEVWYRAGRIPGAISIPAEDAPLAAVDVSRPKRLLFPERLPQDRGRLLVFYCGGPT
jgi:rhodanese-related sulfurtransferase